LATGFFAVDYDMLRPVPVEPLQWSRPMLVDLCDTIAPDYDSLHGRWLRYAGGEAQAAFEGATTGLLRPGMRVVDVGCGTGEFARRLMASCDFYADFTLVDPSTAMLARSTDLPVRRARRTIFRFLTMHSIW
jgi:ubiquinone/menaquinone biosynthesis C-methylase UbiE